MIGVNTATDTAGEASLGISFAIPFDGVTGFLRQPSTPRVTRSQGSGLFLATNLPASDPLRNETPADRRRTRFRDAGACRPRRSQSWNGTWTGDTSRPEPDGAASDHRFTITTDGGLQWEIPSLKENNLGRLDGTPMRINRPGAPPGLTISVWSTAPDVLRYRVALNGRARGEGRMTLAADGRSRTDVPLNQGRPVERLTMVYRRS